MLRAAEPQVNRFNKVLSLLTKKEKKNLLHNSFSFARRTITGRSTRVESSREQAGAKVETNVIKEDERSVEERE